jgi:hypothetical protein
MRHSKLLLSAFLIVGGILGTARSASAQFQLLVQFGSTTEVVGNGANVPVTANGVGQPVQVTLTATYVGAGTATLGTPQLLGSTAFTLGSGASANLTSGQSASYTIVYTPASGAQAFANLAIPNSGAGGSISLSFTGSTPNFVFGYAIQPQGNAVPLSSGGTLTFPPTAVGATTTASLAIENTGSAAGTLNSLTISGTAFQTVALALLPATIGSGQTLQVTIAYTPTAAAADTGTIQLAFPGQNVTFNLAGTGTQLTFTLTQGTQTLVVNQNQVSLAPTTVGGTAIVSVTATNAGNANSVVDVLSLTGVGFQLLNAPPVPQTIVPGGSLNLTFIFTPPQGGNFIGLLTIGGTTLTIRATGSGPLYTFSFTTGSVVNPVSPNGSIFFATAQLGQSSSTIFTVTNTGTAPGIISGIFVGEADSPFTITGLPPVPVTIGLNQTVSFGITFTPTTVTSVSGTLHLDGLVFLLTGAGGAPPPFPSYSFSGPQGTLGPLQQPTVSLTLATPYPLAVTGTLTMTVAPSGFSADPAIQFSTGGRTVMFSIAPNTTAAVFANGSESIELQTGSTSGTITLTPVFQTLSGVSLTPAVPPSLQLVVPPAAPLLIGAQVTAQSATTITLAIAGVSNSQTLTELDLSFTPAAGYTLSGGSVHLSLASVAGAWFQSAAAQAFGGQFVATITFTFGNGSSSVSTTSTTIFTAAVSGVSITVTNAQGTSPALVVPLP